MPKHQRFCNLLSKWPPKCPLPPPPKKKTKVKETFKLLNIESLNLQWQKMFGRQFIRPNLGLLGGGTSMTSKHESFGQLNIES